MHAFGFLKAWALLALLRVCTAGACHIDEDCSLNGICNRGHCKCDPGWWGDDCGRLDFAPATRGTGYNHTDATSPDYLGVYGNSSWGGQILQDRDDDKLFHLVTSQFGNGCGLSGWRPHSYVIRAESTTGPQGPYHYAQRISSTFRHNPYTFWSPADKKYLLYTIGVDVEEPANCKSISVTNWPNNISVSAADSIRGPWTPWQILINGTNPAPWPAWSEKRHTSEIILGAEDLNIFTADSWDSKYELVNTAPWNTSDYSPTWAEDPFLWRDKRGHWHALTHWMIDIVEHDGQKYPRVGAHMFSRTLTGKWNFHQHEAFNATVNFTDGSSQTLNRRERAKLYFSDDGQMTPLYMINGVQDIGSKASYTLIQPIGTAWKKYEKHLGF